MLLNKREENKRDWFLGFGLSSTTWPRCTVVMAAPLCSRFALHRVVQKQSQRMAIKQWRDQGMSAQAHHNSLLFTITAEVLGDFRTVWLWHGYPCCTPCKADGFLFKNNCPVGDQSISWFQTWTETLKSFAKKKCCFYLFIFIFSLTEFSLWMRIWITFILLFSFSPSCRSACTCYHPETFSWIQAPSLRSINFFLLVKMIPVLERAQAKPQIRSFICIPIVQLLPILLSHSVLNRLLELDLMIPVGPSNFQLRIF